MTSTLHAARGFIPRQQPCLCSVKRLEPEPSSVHAGSKKHHLAIHGQGTSHTPSVYYREMLKLPPTRTWKTPLSWTMFGRWEET